MAYKTQNSNDMVAPAFSYMPIDKEIIPFLNFGTKDVLSNDQDRRKRILDIANAMILGNNHKRKVKIYFKDKDGEKCVETTIWMATEDNVVLKSSTMIPVNAILRIDMF